MVRRADVRTITPVVSHCSTQFSMFSVPWRTPENQQTGAQHNSSTLPQELKHDNIQLLCTMCKNTCKFEPNCRLIYCWSSSHNKHLTKGWAARGFQRAAHPVEKWVLEFFLKHFSAINTCCLTCMSACRSFCSGFDGCLICIEQLGFTHTGCLQCHHVGWTWCWTVWHQLL